MNIKFTSTSLLLTYGEQFFMVKNYYTVLHNYIGANCEWEQVVLQLYRGHKQRKRNDTTNTL